MPQCCPALCCRLQRCLWDCLPAKKSVPEAAILLRRNSSPQEPILCDSPFQSSDHTLSEVISWFSKLLVSSCRLYSLAKVTVEENFKCWPHLTSLRITSSKSYLYAQKQQMTLQQVRKMRIWKTLCKLPQGPNPTTYRHSNFGLMRNGSAPLPHSISASHFKLLHEYQTQGRGLQTALDICVGSSCLDLFQVRLQNRQVCFGSLSRAWCKALLEAVSPHLTDKMSSM